MCCKEYESPTRTVYAAVEQYAFTRIRSSVPDLWDDDVDIWCKVDVIADALCIDVELLSKHIGVAHEIRDISRKIILGETDQINAELTYVVREFGERTFIHMR